MSGSWRHDVKLAAGGSDPEDKMYEPKHKKKLVRVLTVIAYVFSVSLAAITLSLFYIFIYKPDRPPGRVPPTHHVQNMSIKFSDERLLNRTWEGPEEPRALPVQIAETLQYRHDDVAHFHGDEPLNTWDDHQLAYNKRSTRDISRLLKIRNEKP